MSLKRHIYNYMHPVICEVWQLHRVTNEVASDEKERTYEITPRYLESRIQEALKKGCKFVSLSTFNSQLSTLNSPTSFSFQLSTFNFIVVTLDDGYADNFEQAYPVFMKYNIPFCIYLTRDYITEGHRDYRFLSADQLMQLAADPLCTLGCHTCSHPRLAQLDEQTQRREITECKQWIEELTGKPVLHLAYPYGSYNSTTLEIARQAGFATAVAAWGGGLRKGKSYDRFAIPRVLIIQDKTTLDE